MDVAARNQAKGETKPVAAGRGPPFSAIVLVRPLGDSRRLKMAEESQ